MLQVQLALPVSERRACQVLGQPRGTQRYVTQEDEEEQRLIARLQELVREHPRYGYRFMVAILRREGWRVNRKRVYRLWQQEGFQVPRKQRKKRRLGSSAGGCLRRRAEHKDHVWAWDFVFDRTANGRSIKWLSIVDEYTRECLALEVDRSMTSRGCAGRAARSVRDSWRAEVHSQRQRPGVYRPGDSPVSVVGGRGARCTSNRVRRGRTAMRRASTAGCGASCSTPRSSRMCARPSRLAASWRGDYNHYRPHSSLGYQTPAEFAAACAASAPATPAPPAAHARTRSITHSPTPTLITPGTKNGGRSTRLVRMVMRRQNNVIR